VKPLHEATLRELAEEILRRVGSEDRADGVPPPDGPRPGKGIRIGVARRDAQEAGGVPPAVQP